MTRKKTEKDYLNDLEKYARRIVNYSSDPNLLTELKPDLIKLLRSLDEVREHEQAVKWAKRQAAARSKLGALSGWAMRE